MHVVYHVNILRRNIKVYKKWIHAIYSENRVFEKLGRHIGRGLKKTIFGGIMFRVPLIMFRVPPTMLMVP